MTVPDRIPADRRERFAEVAALVEQFGAQHLDAELTGIRAFLFAPERVEVMAP